MTDELDYWRYQAFKLSQVVCSCTYETARTPGTFGNQWFTQAVEVQDRFRALGLDETKIGNPDRDKWNPEWEKRQARTLRVWGEGYDSKELARNFEKIDLHDGTPGRGVNNQDDNSSP